MCVSLYLLVEADSVLLQSEDVVGEHHDLVVASLVELDEELTGSELVGVHGVEENTSLRLDGHVFPVKLRGHRTPHLDEGHSDVKLHISMC